MIVRLIRMILLANAIVVLPLACASNQVVAEDPAGSVAEDSILSRPYIEKPQPRPLGRVLLKWSPVEGATGYKLEMSETELFEAVDRNWTISGTSLEMPVAAGDTLWFRVRSFDGSTSSRWSAVQMVEG